MRTSLIKVRNRKNLIAAVECGLDTTTLSAMGTTFMSDFQGRSATDHPAVSWPSVAGVVIGCG